MRTACGKLRSPHRLAPLRPECFDGGEVTRGLVGECLGVDVEELLHCGRTVLEGPQELLKSSPTLKLRRKTSWLPAVSPTVTTSTYVPAPSAFVSSAPAEMRNTYRP